MTDAPERYITGNDLLVEFRDGDSLSARYDAADTIDNLTAERDCWHLLAVVSAKEAVKGWNACAEARQERDEARAEVERLQSNVEELRRALNEIAETPIRRFQRKIARAALAETDK